MSKNRDVNVLRINADIRVYILYAIHLIIQEGKSLWISGFSYICNLLPHGAFFLLPNFL